MRANSGGWEGLPREIVMGLEKAGITESTVQWSYRPEGYDLVVLEHDVNGEKAASWSVAQFTEASVGARDQPRMFEYEAEKGAKNRTQRVVHPVESNLHLNGEIFMKVIDQFKGSRQTC
jgi:hypothetical protein